MLRQTFLFLSRRKALRRWFETSSTAARLTTRFVAGNTLDDVMRVATALHSERILSSLDHLGENVTSRSEATVSRQFFESALQRVAASSLPATISIKLTQLGMDLGDDLCHGHTEILVRQAHDIGSRVEIDMESSEYVDRTLAVASSLHQQYGCVRSVLQAYLYRTEEDARRLSALGLPIRLCKGAYREPASVAFPKKSDVDANYLKLATFLLDHGSYPAFATHDPRMIEGILAHVAKTGRQSSDFEFQMLYGVRRDLQRQLVAAGWRLRLYVPYGTAWYPYFMRRLAERPANVLFLAKGFLNG